MSTFSISILRKAFTPWTSLHAHMDGLLNRLCGLRRMIRVAYGSRRAVMTNQLGRRVYTAHLWLGTRFKLPADLKSDHIIDSLCKCSAALSRLHTNTTRYIRDSGLSNCQDFPSNKFFEINHTHRSQMCPTGPRFCHHPGLFSWTKYRSPLRLSINMPPGSCSEVIYGIGKSLPVGVPGKTRG